MSEQERLVQLITERVKERLGSIGEGFSPCSADKSQCEGGGCCVRRRPNDVRALVELGACRVGAAGGIGAPAADIARLIDHTLLKPDATRADLEKVCDEARKHCFATVCVNASNIRFVASRLQGSGVVPIAVVGFPLGATTAASKAFEAREAVRNGAGEIDMVINVGALKDRDYATALTDIVEVVKASAPAPVKVILETGSLTDEEKIIGCTLSKVGGAAFVKTSTGFGPGGATAADIALMRRVVGPEMGVKASGGVRTREDLDKMVAAGATRIGASASVAIVQAKPAEAAAAPKAGPRGRQITPKPWLANRGTPETPPAAPSSGSSSSSGPGKY